MANFDKTGIPRAAYLHIPFCRRRCYYCDFPISVLGNKTDINTSPSIEEYVRALCQEIAITPAFGSPLDTVFFGGGTPSLLPVRCLEDILEAIAHRFGLAAGAEISLEVDPGTFDLAQLQGYQQLGVNRLSLGVQAFQDELLQICGRFQQVKDIFEAIELIHQVGIANFSLDLISGLPQQTIEQWQFSLERAVEIAPHHLSCYDLVLEPVTAFGKKYQAGVTPLPADETAAEMYRLARQILTDASYEHYEISNYARPGFQCRHNRVYWQNYPYYGFGMGAASYYQKKRFTRPRTRGDYYAWLENLKVAKGAIDSPELSEMDILLETLMLGLRLQEGVSKCQICEQFNQKIWQKIGQILEPYCQQKWVVGIGKNGGQIEIKSQADWRKVEGIRLSDPEGFLFSNRVLTALFEQL